MELSSAPSSPGSCLAPTSEELRAELDECLTNIQSDGSFALFEHLSNPPNPGLYLKNGGLIGLPLTEREAQVIVAASHAAPFGKGEQTIVDNSVRKTWELSACDFEIRNGAWQPFLKSIVAKVATGLGVDATGKGVSAELYKMLLYDEGAMFKPHQDSEKSPHMFATLVIALPSKHEGGEVRVTHSGKTKTFETSKFSEFDSSYLAWFADVTHEVKPVLAGHRLVLTYNLTHTTLGSEELEAKSDKSMSKLRFSLSNWKENLEKDDLPAKLAFLLQHQYTDASLCYDSLKGHDHQVAAHLREACKEYGFCFYLANIDRTVYGDCDEGNYDYYCDGIGEGFHEITENVVRHTTLKIVVDLDGTEVEHDLDFDEKHFIQKDPFKNEEPDDEDYSGFTGNAGVSATHFYHRTAALIVPRARRMEFFLISGKETSSYASSGSPKQNPKVIQWIDRLAVDLAKDSTDNSAREDLVQICQMVIRHSRKWKSAPTPADPWLRTSAPFSDEVVSRVVTLSVELDDEKMFLDAFDLYSVNVATETFQAVGAALLRYGLKSLIPKLSVSLSTLSVLSNRLDVLEQIRAGLEKESKQKSKNDPTYQTWLYTETILALFPTVEMKSEKDGTSLINISRRLPSQDLFKIILPAVKRNINKTAMVIAFLTGLFDPDLAGEFPEDVARTIFHDLIADLADSFSLYSLAAELSESNKKATQPHYMMGSRHPAPTLIFDHRNSHNLATLLYHCQKLELTTELNHFVKKLVAEANIAPLDFFEGVYLPSLKILITLLPSDNTLKYSPFQVLFQQVLSQYIIRYVGPAPTPPIDWNQTPVDCGCGDCRSLNGFLTNPSETVGTFAIGKERRRHLDTMLNKRNAGRTHDTERLGSPHTLVVTKTLAGYHAMQKAWVSRCEVARKHLEELGKEVLKEFLGEMYGSIMGLEVAQLLSAGKTTKTSALAENDNASNRVLEPPTRRKVPANVIVIDD